LDAPKADEHPATIAAVAPDSAAARAGLRPGDRLLAINGAPLPDVVRDVIDVQVHASEPVLGFLIEREGRRLEREVARRYGEPLGLTFAAPLFDGRPPGQARTCCNNCEFCFVNQMPPGMRPSLYVKDDDYRLSFLHGNYITLTNLAPRDWDRIEAQHLSPLYVSVHATAPEVRRALLRHPRAGRIMAQLRRLADLGITVHTQAVLVPGRNDGPHLTRTLNDLAGLHPHVLDLTLVPVGLTRWHSPNLRPYTPAEAAAVIEQAHAQQARLRETLGVGFVYLADEWYLRAGVPVPPKAAYDGQIPALIENGVGMVRQFRDSWDALQATLAPLGGPRQTWVTGMLFAPTLRERAAAFTRATGIAADVVAVPNRAFGETVTVAGLLTASDVLAALRAQGEARPLGDVIVLPDEAFRGPQGQSLDEATPQDLQRALDRDVYTLARQGETWTARGADAFDT
jgi:putative radical SAM enzyme (TIGR03279 family)